MQDKSTLISVKVDEDQERQEKNSTFSVTFSSVPSGAVFSPRILTFTIPPNDLDVKLDSMGPFKFEKDATTLTLTFTTDGLQDKKTFAVSSPDTRVAVRTGLITIDQDSFDVVLGLTEGTELERRETIELEISHLDALQPSARDSAQISAGEHHTCAIRIDNTVACWGNPDNGQTIPTRSEQDVTEETKFLAVSAGGAHTCGIRIDGTAACWGSNANNRSSLTSSAADQGGPVDESDRFLAVSAGSFHTCAIRIDGTPACWGSRAHNRSIPPDGFRARIIPDTFYLLEKQDMNVPLEIRSAVRLRIRVFLEGALR